VQTITPKLDLAIDAHNFLGETPVWVAREQALYWINVLEPPELHRWDAGTAEHRVWPMPGRIGGVAITEAGGIIVALADGLYDFTPDANQPNGELKLRAKSPLVEGAALHETGCDRQGRLWVGGIGRRVDDKTQNEAALFRLIGNTLVPVLESFACSNGLAVAPDGRRLYHTDCMTGVLERWDLDPATGNISNPREFFRLPLDQGLIDGATVDAEGGYWAAVFMGAKLLRLLPDGTPDLEVRLPFKNPTKVMFGGPDLDTLYITVAGLKLDPNEPDTANAGGVFSFKPGVKGLPEPLVK
jgi:sugar lactone lactonase YvrE